MIASPQQLDQREAAAANPGDSVAIARPAASLSCVADFHPRPPFQDPFVSDPWTRVGPRLCEYLGNPFRQLISDNVMRFSGFLGMDVHMTQHTAL